MIREPGRAGLYGGSSNSAAVGGGEVARSARWGGLRLADMALWYAGFLYFRCPGWGERSAAGCGSRAAGRPAPHRAPCLLYGSAARGTQGPSNSRPRGRCRPRLALPALVPIFDCREPVRAGLGFSRWHRDFSRPVKTDGRCAAARRGKRLPARETGRWCEPCSRGWIEPCSRGRSGPGVAGGVCDQS